MAKIARYAAGTRELLECFLSGRLIRDEYLIVNGGGLAGTGAVSHTSADLCHDQGRARVVATYQYRCAQDGDFDVSRPIGMAAPQVRCAACGVDAVRVFTSPMLSLASRAIVAAIDRSERTRDQPDLVSSLPPDRGRKQPTTARGKPTLQPLPRP